MESLVSYHRAFVLIIAESPANVWPGLIVQFLWHFFSIGARVLALTLFAIQFPQYLIIVFVVHFVVMFVLDHLLRPNKFNNRFERLSHQAAKILVSYVVSPVNHFLDEMHPNLSADTRNDCKKCRLDKCFALGMKCNFQSDENEIQIIECKITERQSNTGEKIDGESEESYNEYTNYDSIGDEFVQQIATNIVIGNKESYNSALIPISKPLTDYNGLKQLEFSRISEAIGASKAFIEPIAKNIYKTRDKIEFLAIKSQMNDKLAKNTIKYTKGLKGFADLRPEDQYSLFNLRTRADSSTMMLDKLFNKFLDNVCPEWQWDLIVLDLLTAIILFNPNRPNLIHRDIIRLEQQLYLLLKYSSESESQTKLQTFMTSLKDLEAIHDIQRWELTKEWEYVSPLVKEIFE
ncbi:unnamed protein product, partial [Medioppia subpectinata]